MGNDYLQLYAHNRIVAGQDRAAIYDLHHGRVRLLPTAVIPLLEAFGQSPIQSIAKCYFADSTSILDRYINFLLKEDLAFRTPTPDLFPPQTTDWHSPYRLTTAVIAHDSSRSTYNLARIIPQIAALNCHSLELWLNGYPTNTNAAAWRKLTKLLSEQEFQQIEIFVHKSNPTLEATILSSELLNAVPRLGRVILLDSPTTANITAADSKTVVTNTTHRTVREFAKRPQDDRTIFVAGKYFRQALVANPYFNRRIAIDYDGNYRNDLLHANTEFGHVDLMEPGEVIKREDFQRLWRAKPDDIAEINTNPLRYCLPYDRPLHYCSTRSSWAFSD